MPTSFVSRILTVLFGLITSETRKLTLLQGTCTKNKQYKVLYETCKLYVLYLFNVS